MIALLRGCNQGGRPAQLDIERQGLAEGVVDQRVTEEGPVVAGLTAERRPVLRGGGDHDCVRICERRHELTRKTGLEHQQPVLEAELIEHSGQARWRDDAGAALHILVDRP